MKTLSGRDSPAFLSTRDLHAVEEMDKADCDGRKLHRTYAQFPLINAVVSGWRRTYTEHIKALLSATRKTTLLDIGCGGADVSRRLARWAARDGLWLEITAIDPDDRALAFALAQPPVPRLSFRQAFSAELVADGAVFDVVISNHMLHHLTPAQFQGLLADSTALATAAVIHSDIVRSPVAYALFAAGTLPFFPGSYIRRDGLTSIRRSYTPGELRAIAPPAWTVAAERPYRNLLLLTPAGGSHA